MLEHPGIAVPASRKVTLPVGVPTAPPTVAVSVTGSPLFEGSGVDTSCTLGVACAGAENFTATGAAGPDVGAVRPSAYTAPPFGMTRSASRLEVVAKRPVVRIAPVSAFCVVAASS